MKPKNLSKKIRRLEVRLQKGAKKLAKLKQKLEAAAAASAAKKKTKSAVRAREVRKKVKSSGRAEKKTAAIKRPSTVKKVKIKLNLTPERRAQLAAAMKARWAAKRAAADATTQNTSTEQGFIPGQGPQPQ
jgi:nitrogen fixation protein FixH